MVHIVKGSPVCQGYREANRQLAKELNETKQLLSEVFRESREEIHRCHMRILELEQLEAYKEKYYALKRAIENLAHESPNTSVPSQSIILPLPPASETNKTSGLEPISESEEPDSLEPADVTSVPSLHPCGQTPEQMTLSIWKCLDETPRNDMFESTPRKPALSDATSRINQSDAEIKRKRKEAEEPAKRQKVYNLRKRK